MSDKLNIQTEMRAYDLKDRDFYDSLTEDEVKKFSPYLMLRYGASVEGSAEMQAWYLMATNERVNVNFFDVNTTKHKKLQWLMCTAASPGMGVKRHYWLATKKDKSVNSKTVKFLATLYPEMKTDELELLASINSTADIKDLARQHGWTDKRIKDEL